MKHTIRHTIIPYDDAEALKQWLRHLSGPDQYSLFDTMFKYDSVNCFRLLKTKFYNIDKIIKYAPPEICLELYEDRKLFHYLMLNQMHNKELGEYFCKAFYQKPYFTDSLNFYLYGNYQPAFFLLDKLEDDIDTRYFALLLGDLDNLKPYSTKYQTLWKYLTAKQKMIVDPQRKKKEDWEELVNFPWQGFLTIDFFSLWEILKMAYPTNVHLHSRKKTDGPDCVSDFLCTYRDFYELKKFPWECFTKIDDYSLFEIMKMSLPSNHCLFSKTGCAMVGFFKNSHK